MSFEAMAWAVKQNTANSGQKLVLLMLANHANGYSGQCNPSHKRLAEECCMGISTLKGHIQALQDAGFLKVVNRFNNNSYVANQYELQLPLSQNLTYPQSESDLPLARIGLQKQEVKQERETVEAKRATRLPQELELPQEWITFCLQERKDLDPVKVFAGFKDFWLAKAGKDACKLDWFATWRNWVRNQRQGTNVVQTQNRWAGGI